MDITATDLQAKLSAHARWLAGDKDGVQLDLSDTALLGANLSEADLRRANLIRADLRGADMRWADLRGANLREADLRGASLIRADLRGVDLRGADMRWANLTQANMSGANLREADLRRADLRDADLRWADLDFSCWPLWCGSQGAVVDARIAAQLAAHFCALTCDDPAYQEARAVLLPFARTSHRAKDLGLIEDEEDRYD